jgi:hypothetical protein
MKEPPKWRSSIIVDAPPFRAKHICTDCRGETHWRYYQLGSTIYAVMVNETRKGNT